MIDRARVPRYLHLPIQILWFDMEDIGVILASYAVWLVLDSWLALPLVVLVPWLFMSLKADKPRGFLGHALYGLGIHRLTLYPPPDIEEFHE